MTFDPKTKKYPFPEDTSSHYIIVKKNNRAVFDKNYPYIDNSSSFRRKQKLIRALLYLIVFPVARIRMGLRIKGRNNLKKHREVLKNGVISCCNHVHFWDFISIMDAIKPFKPYHLSWATNVRGENASLIRLVGGIPIPEDDIKATMSMMSAVKQLLNNNGWLHIYSEGSMWEYYQPIRPFKTGTAAIACMVNKPLLPMAFSYRKPGFVRRVIFHQIALLTLNIGEPIYCNQSLPLNEQKIDLTIRCHNEVCKLAGINPEYNLYEPVYNNSRRKDYY